MDTAFHSMRCSKQKCQTAEQEDSLMNPPVLLFCQGCVNEGALLFVGHFGFLLKIILITCDRFKGRDRI